MNARPVLRAALLAAAALALTGAAQSQTAAPAKPPAKPVARPAAKAPAKPAPKGKPELIVPEATMEQMKAAELVYLGHYECEFNQVVDIAPSEKHKGYVDVKHGKGAWVMRPVLSSTGAVRLEDVMDETLMVQIASKSMLLNVKTGRRIVDECVSPRQRELIDAARAEKAAEAARQASLGASGAASAPGNVLLR